MPKTCLTTESIKVIGARPKLLILRYLDGIELGFNELKKQCGLSSRTLALNLQFLLKKDVVQVRKYQNRKFYSLTEKGNEAVLIIQTIGNWGKKWSIWE